MNRRAFLARSLRLPAAVAALPFVGGLATLESEAQTEAEPVYDWWQISMESNSLFFHDLPAPADGEIAGALWGRGVPMAARNVLIRDEAGTLIRWGLDTGWHGWQVRP